MELDPKIINLIATLEAQAQGALETAALLRQKLLAGGRPVASRKGKSEPDPEIIALASMKYRRKQLRKTYLKK